jgi:hypothetical protein
MTTATLARYNTARVLRLLWLRPGISRVEMAEQLGLNRSTVTLIINELLERELVKTVDFGDASPTGGRKKAQLAINAGYGCVGGVQVHADYVRVALVDLGGRLLHQQVIEGAVTQKSLYRRLEKACAQLQQRARQIGLNLLGIGCGLPGIVDPVRGVLVQSIPLGVLDEEPIVQRLGPALGRPLFVDNDAHCCCWGELTCARDGAANFLFVMGEWRRAPHQVGALLTAIGIGVVLNRTVHYGRGFSAGEFRSVEWRPGNTSQFSLTDDQIAAARTDPALHRAMVRELARNTAVVVHILNLDRLYLGGSFDRQDLEIQAIFTEEIRRNWTYPTAPMCEVEFSTHGELAVVYGAAGLILERAFADPSVLADRSASARVALLTPA